MRHLLSVPVVFLLLASTVRAGQSPPQLLLRIHVQTTGSGMSETAARTVMLPPNGEPIQVRAMPEVSERNLIGVDPQPGGTMLQFDHAGQINLSAVTAQDQGRILVVFLNGYIIYSPIIDEQITNGRLLLPHPLAPEIVKLLQEIAAQNLRNHNHT